MDNACCHEQEGRDLKLWFKKPLFLVLLAAVTLHLASFASPLLQPYRLAFIEYLRIIGWPITLGFILGGLIDYYIPKEYISKFLTRPHKRTILYSAGLGFLMSACSHGIIALSMELHKKGASGPAVVSFLLASPWANLPVTFLLVGFFGWKGVLLIFSALLVSVTTGLIFQRIDQKGRIEKNRHSVLVSAEFSILGDIKRRWKEYRFSWAGAQKDFRGILKGIWELAEMVLWWVVIGMILASLIGAFVPSHFFMKFFGPTLFGLIITLLAAAVMEVCSEGTSPLAFEIYKQTGAFGNTFAFLMGGVVTDYTEVGLVWSNLGKRTALWMLAVTLPQVFLLGWVFNVLF